jgi:hypothetical protein
MYGYLLVCLLYCQDVRENMSQGCQLVIEKLHQVTHVADKSCLAAALTGEGLAVRPTAA